MIPARKLDTTIYPDTDHMGEGELQQLINETLRPLLARFLASRGIVAHVGSNTFIYTRQFDSSSRIAPDIYVLPGVPQERISRSWKLWELPAPPSVAIEVVSLDVDKDYIEAREIHAEIGTAELVVFDPESRGRKDRHLWQVFRRVRGVFRVVDRTNTDRVYCRELGCWLRGVGRGDAQRVRVATGARGARLFPTEAEAERAEREALERENARLEDELAQARRGQPRGRARTRSRGDAS